MRSISVGVLALSIIFMYWLVCASMRISTLHDTDVSFFPSFFEQIKKKCIRESNIQNKVPHKDTDLAVNLWSKISDSNTEAKEEQIILRWNASRSSILLIIWLKQVIKRLNIEEPHGDWLDFIAELSLSAAVTLTSVQ